MYRHSDNLKPAFVSSSTQKMYVKEAECDCQVAVSSTLREVWPIGNKVTTVDLYVEHCDFVNMVDILGMILLIIIVRLRKFLCSHCVCEHVYLRSLQTRL